jgi:hypothetical protein
MIRSLRSVLTPRPKMKRLSLAILPAVLIIIVATGSTATAFEASTVVTESGEPAITRLAALVNHLKSRSLPTTSQANKVACGTDFCDKDNPCCAGYTCTKPDPMARDSTGVCKKN